MNLKSVLTITAIALVTFITTIAKAQEPLHSLTENQLSDLRIHSSRAIQLTPGDTTFLKIKAWTEHMYPPMLIDLAIKAEWFITPNIGVELDRKTGELLVEKTAEPGAEFTITAIIEEDEQEQKIQNTLHIYTPTSNPFVGTWSDINMEVKELIFRADRTFSVTASPFESYVDYWGKYNYDIEKKIIQFEVTGGNNIPNDKKQRGFYKLPDKDTLIFKDVYFGTLNESFRKRDRYTFHKN